MKKLKKLGFFVVPIILAIAIVIGQIIINEQMKPYREADELKEWLEKQGFLVIEVTSIEFGPNVEVYDYSFSFVIWFLHIQNKTETTILKDGYIFYYRYLNTTDYHKFDAKYGEKWH